MDILNDEANSWIKYGKDENLAISFTMRMFRDTIIEDFHSECVKMDMDFYYDSCDYLDGLIKNVKKCKKVIAIYYENDTYKKYMEKKNNNELSGMEQTFYRDIFYYIKHNSWWDCPELIPNSKPSFSANYIYGGKFLEQCQRGSKLNDTVMNELNHDICNRFYTLIKSGYFKNSNN